MTTGTTVATPAVEYQDPFAWVEKYLDVWVRYETRDDTDLDLPSQAAGVVPSGFWGYRDPLGEWERQGERRAVDMIQAELDAMLPNESAAVRHIKLGTRYIYDQVLLDYAYFSARMKIAIRLRRGDFT